MDDGDKIVGHKTFRSEDGLGFRHEPLTKREAEALHEHAERCRLKRETDMPTERAAINAMFEAWYRLKELGWSEAMYCPKDGTHFKVIESGSTGIFDCVYEGKWPKGHWTTFDEHYAYPSSIAPVLFRRYPEDEAKHKAKMEQAAARYRADRETEEHII